MKPAGRIFQAQRRLGSAHATEFLQETYTPIAFDQRPLADSDDKVGKCDHEPSEKRTAKRAPSFEIFRFLARLRNLRLLTAAGPVELSPEQVATAADGFGKALKITFKHLRDRLDLAIGVRFDGVPPAEEKTRDVAARVGARPRERTRFATRWARPDGGHCFPGPRYSTARPKF